MFLKDRQINQCLNRILASMIWNYEECYPYCGSACSRYPTGCIELFAIQ